MSDPRSPVQAADPRHVPETFANAIVTLYHTAGLLHVTLGVDRPVPQAKPGEALEIQREVAARLVMPEAVAAQLAEVIRVSLAEAANAAAQTPRPNA